jgi:hypothetical protein
MFQLQEAMSLSRSKIKDNEMKTDIQTDNNHNFTTQFMSDGKKDIVLHSSESVCIIALGNILAKNKAVFIQDGMSYDIANSFVLNKAIELGLKPTLIVLDKNAYMNGDLKISYNLTGKNQDN